MRRYEAIGLVLAFSTLLACSGESTDSGSGDAAGEDGGEESGEDGGEDGGEESGEDGGEGSGEGGGEDGGEDGGEEDSVEIASFSVTECAGDTGTIPEGDEALSATVSDGSIHVEHLAVVGNCCPFGWDMGVTEKGSELNVWYDGDGDCDCECLYDLNYEITGASSGTWTLSAGGASVEVVVP